MPETQQHDAIFSKCLSNVEAAKDYLKLHLPKKLLKRVALHTLEICNTKFIDARLRAQHTDVLFRMKMKEEDNYVYVLYTLNEHQSIPQEIMPLRVIRYEAGIMYQHWNEFKTVPIVHTIVYFNGKQPWNYSRSVYDLIKAPPELIREYVFQPFGLLILKDISDEYFLQTSWAGSMGLIMKHIHDHDLMPTLMVMATLLRRIVNHPGPEDGQEYIAALLYYACAKGEVRDERAFKSLLHNLFNEQTGVTIMSYFEQIERRGRETGILQGMQQGIQQGMQQGLQKGIKKGLQEGELRAAKKFLAAGLEPEFVAKTIGAKLEWITELQREDLLEE